MNNEEKILLELNNLKELNEKEFKHLDQRISDQSKAITNLDKDNKEFRKEVNVKFDAVNDRFYKIENNDLKHIEKDLSYTKGILYILNGMVIAILIKVYFG
ncbi:MAG: hypothetical protein LBB45_05695 [Methanobrevibacter sp.]|jgi:predicted RNase H-like nuclease (RuvC/YqgF family)|nr:hypothetical protein [Candidatus Methanovirga basalitermitum]